MTDHPVPAELTAILEALRAGDSGGASNFAVGQLRAVVTTVERAVSNAETGHGPNATKLLQEIRGKHRAVAYQAEVAQRAADAMAKAIEHAERLA